MYSQKFSVDHEKEFKCKKKGLNFVIHFIKASELFAINDFNVSHIVGLRIVMLRVERGADG